MIDTDIQAAFELAVTNQSMMRLDALGINTAMDRLPSFASYHESTRALFGYNWITRLWYRRVRPVLFPGRHQKARREVERLSEALKAEFWENVRRQWATDGDNHDG